MGPSLDFVYLSILRLGSGVAGIVGLGYPKFLHVRFQWGSRRIADLPMPCDLDAAKTP